MKKKQTFQNGELLVDITFLENDIEKKIKYVIYQEDGNIKFEILKDENVEEINRRILTSEIVLSHYDFLRHIVNQKFPEKVQNTKITFEISNDENVEEINRLILVRDFVLSHYDFLREIVNQKFPKKVQNKKKTLKI